MLAARLSKELSEASGRPEEALPEREGWGGTVERAGLGQLAVLQAGHAAGYESLQSLPYDQPGRRSRLK